jgi:hypothetical protein
MGRKEEVGRHSCVSPQCRLARLVGQVRRQLGRSEEKDWAALVLRLSSETAQVCIVEHV